MLLPSIFGENLFDDFFDDVPFFDNRAENQIEKKLYGRHAHNVMKTDIKETDDNYELIVDLPGFKKDEIKVSLEDGYLTIEAAKGLDEDEQEKKTGKYIRKERYAGACQRSFYVGDNLTQEDIKGEFKHGILTLNVPKKEAKQGETIQPTRLKPSSSMADPKIIPFGTSTCGTSPFSRSSPSFAAVSFPASSII